MDVKAIFAKIFFVFGLLSLLSSILIFLLKQFSLVSTNALELRFTIPDYGYIIFPTLNLDFFTITLFFAVGIILIILAAILSGFSIQTSGLLTKLLHFREHSEIKAELKKIDKTLEDLKEFRSR